MIDSLSNDKGINLMVLRPQIRGKFSIFNDRQKSERYFKIKILFKNGKLDKIWEKTIFPYNN